MKAVADELGLSASFVNNVEAGERKLPPEHVKPWAKAVGLKPEVLAKALLREEHDSLAAKIGVKEVR